MKLFACPSCANPIFFENVECLNCHTIIGYDPEKSLFAAVPIDQAIPGSMPYCRNHSIIGCNWLTETSEEYCLSCRLTRKIPNFADTENVAKWATLETAKRRLIYQLIKLQLPLTTKTVDPQKGLAFDFLTAINQENVATGHVNGVITIILAEADSVYREQMRKKMSEPYRTLLGHFRHEIGHYYWNLLFNEHNLSSYRRLFGDENADYGQALQQYYQYGAPADWQNNFISRYATSHSWEDWAESWAHYLHLMDTLETSAAFGITLQPEISNSSYLLKDGSPDPYLERNFDVIFRHSVALTCAANSINRSMGIPDVYPFVVPGPVIKKLAFIHELVC